jgi:hypothetical protein
MSYILYYSNFCNHSQTILKDLSKSKIKEDIHFICIDNRIKENDKMYVVLEQNKKIILPNVINRVPALMSLKDYTVFFGEDINKILYVEQKQITQVATQNNFEPYAFSFDDATCSGVISDNFSFIDTPAEDLKADGNGGVRQLHQYFKYDQQDTMIHGSSDGYGSKNEKLPSSLTIEQLQQQRNNDPFIKSSTSLQPS